MADKRIRVAIGRSDEGEQSFEESQFDTKSGYLFARFVDRSLLIPAPNRFTEVDGIRIKPTSLPILMYVILTANL
jgi:hypothetical protein